MGHLVETTLWHFFKYAEAYTFLFAWIVIPLGFLSVFLTLKKNSERILRATAVHLAEQEVSDTVHVEEAVPEVPLEKGETNKNLANA